ncbi:MAG: FecR domain-containing protein [Deltaproteobacteria bacterium]|nr:FecR domain-containing protein [Deltaproteobacteria bacterium]
MMLRSLILCTAVLSGNVAAAAPDSGGKLTLVKGQAFTTAAGGSEAKAAQGDSVAPGTKIRTGKDGLVEVTFTDGSLLKIQAGSSLVLSGAKRQKKKNVVVLFFGRVWSKVTKSGGETNYEINTPNAVCGVRGTEFDTVVADDGSARVRVTSGTVGVAGDGSGERAVGANQQVDADDDGVEPPANAEEQAKWDAWQKSKQERLNKDSRVVVDRVKGKIMSRKDKIEGLRAEQKSIEAKRKGAEGRAQDGDSSAVVEIRQYNQRLAEIADLIADLGDQTASQFGIVDHFADLAGDPRFKNIDRKYLEAEAASLRRVKATLDKLVTEGTDISIEGMDKMLKDMSGGKRGSLKDKDSAGDDLFGKDPMDMK